MWVPSQVSLFNRRFCGVAITLTIMISGVVAVMLFRFIVKPRDLDIFIDDGATFQNVTFNGTNHLSVTLSYTLKGINVDHAFFLYYVGLAINVSAKANALGTRLSNEHCFMPWAVNGFSHDVSSYVTSYEPIPRSAAKELQNQDKRGELKLEVSGLIWYKYKAFWMSKIHYASFYCSSAAFRSSTDKVQARDSYCSVDLEPSLSEYHFVKDSIRCHEIHRY